MLPATYNWKIVRGTTSPFSFLLQAQDGDTLVAIPYDDVRLSIYQKNNLLLRPSVSDGRITVDEYASQFTWTPTPEESRLIPIGVKARYELEVWNGTSELVYLLGTIEGIGGINDDQEVS